MNLDGTSVIRQTSLAGKVALITGAARAIGLESARQLGLLGATVVLGVRDVARGHSLSLISGLKGLTQNP